MIGGTRHACHGILTGASEKVVAQGSCAPLGSGGSGPARYSDLKQRQLQLGTKWESRALAGALCRSLLLTCARASSAETWKGPGGGEVDAFLGVKESPVQIRPSRLVVKLFRTVFVMRPMLLGGRPACSAALLGSSLPLCAQCTPDANEPSPRTVRSLASVEGRWSPLASVVVRQSRQQYGLNHTNLRLGCSVSAYRHGTITSAVTWRGRTLAKSRRFTVATVTMDKRSQIAITDASVPPSRRSA